MHEVVWESLDRVRQMKQHNNQENHIIVSELNCKTHTQVKDSWIVPLWPVKGITCRTKAMAEEHGHGSDQLSAYSCLKCCSNSSINHNNVISNCSASNPAQNLPSIQWLSLRQWHQNFRTIFGRALASSLATTKNWSLLGEDGWCS